MKSLWQTMRDWYAIESGGAAREASAEALRGNMAEDGANRGISTDLEGYRQKFKRNLLGFWSTDPGFGPFPVTQWQFFADGTALLIYVSGMIGQHTTHYLWREASDFAIELLELETEKGEDEEPDDDEENEPPTWFRLAYDFKVEDDRIVLFSTPENETFKFYDCPDYMVFQGDHEQQKREEP